MLSHNKKVVEALELVGARDVDGLNKLISSGDDGIPARKIIKMIRNHPDDLESS